jgi:hypothetical protein
MIAAIEGIAESCCSTGAGITVGVAERIRTATALERFTRGLLSGRENGEYVVKLRDGSEPG